MKTRSLSLVVLLSVPAWIVACAGEALPPDTPQNGTAVASAEPPPSTTATAAVTADPTPPTPPPVVAPPPKPGKEKIVGKWQFSFEGEPKAKAEEDAKKKFPKEKDQAKRDAFVKKIGDAAAGEWIEFEGGFFVSHTTDAKGKDKVVLKVKVDVTKDDNTAVSMKAVGKEEVSKKELKDEVSVSFKDDDTISMFDTKKKMNLTFKRK
jgi:hypothetical protein